MFGETPLVVVETPEALSEVAARLAQAPVIGVDTEADSFHHYQEKVCLVQISDLEADYVVDPLSVRDLSPLGPIFANPDQVKIFHGADYDIVSLRRDFGFTFRNLFDTMMAAQFCGLPRVGLADLIHRWFGHVIDKKYQRHDWAERPLQSEHLDYARGDTHFLPALRDVLRRRLVQLDRLAPVEEECGLLEQRAWQGRTRDPSDFYRVKGSTRLDQASLRALRALYAYREQEGARMDRPVFKVIPDEVLLALAERRPTSVSELAAGLKPGSGIVRRHGEALVDVLATAATDTSEVAPPPARERSSEGPALRGRDQERLLSALKAWRASVVEARGIPAVAVVPNAILKEVARRGPRTLEALAAVPDIRRWQVEQWGGEILGVCDIADPPEAPSDAPRKRRRRRRGEAETA